MKNKPGTTKYYLVLLGLGIFLLGPLAGFSAAYMNFKLGFFLGGSMLAGVLGSAVVLLYGKEGRHGANYIQTFASAVGSMSGMVTVLQAMHWLGIPQPPMWQMTFFFLVTGCFGVGVGMLYTPLLVDQWKLAFPSGKAVADILRALTDVSLLKKSMGKLFGGMVLGFAGGKGWLPIPKVWTFPAAWGFSAATLGAGMVVGARIAIPGLVMGAIGLALTPYLQSIGWLQEGEIFRNIGFVIALAMILGAALVHVAPIVWHSFKRLFTEGLSGGSLDWKMVIWTLFWGSLLVFMCSNWFGVPVVHACIAIGLTFVFVLINGISVGVSDSNPISSAFVLTVLILVISGVDAAFIALLCSTIVLISASIGVDMQQDRSTGWRLGSDRTVQFRFQALGVMLGAPFAVLVGAFFFSAFPELITESGSTQWESAMTLKIVGVLKGIGNYEPHQMQALLLGFSIGLTTALLRKFLRKPDENGELRFCKSKTLDFVLDALILPTPFASSFGGFVSFMPTVWFAVGGTISSVYGAFTGTSKSSDSADEDIPDDMSATSLVGGGLIAGETIAYVVIGIGAMAATFL